MPFWGLRARGYSSTKAPGAKAHVPASVFSAARLRAHLVLENEGFLDAVSLQVLERVIAGRLWLPYSLIELGFRNTADRVIVANHASGEDWLIAAGRVGRELIAADVRGAEALLRKREDDSQGGPVPATREEDSPDDPVREAARMAAGQLARERILRDDVIAHLMLGFWVNRCPLALAPAGLNFWNLIAAEVPGLQVRGNKLKDVMLALLRTRNRIAHHEPLIIRSKDVLTKKNEPRPTVNLIEALQVSLTRFTKRVQVATDVATALAPVAKKYLATVPGQVAEDLLPLVTSLAARQSQLLEDQAARAANRAAAWAARQSAP